MSDCTFKASPFCKTILLPPSINSKDEPVGMGAFLIKYTFKSPPPAAAVSTKTSTFI